MNGIAIALIAQVLIGISLVVDKIFLKEEKNSNVFAYVFWIGVFNLFAILFVPLGFAVPSLLIALAALGAGIFFAIGLIFYYTALEKGEASQTLAILGGFTPLATFLISDIFRLSSLSIVEIISFFLLASGGLLFFFTDRIKFKKTIIWVILAAVSFGLVNVFQKIAYGESKFFTSYAIMKMGTFLTAMIFLLVPAWRKKIAERTKATPRMGKIYYLANRAMAGIGSFMLSYAIKLEHPELVEAISGIKYIIIFVIAFVVSRYLPKILKENFRGWVMVGKLLATILIIFGVIMLMVQKVYEEKPMVPDKSITWGITFSKPTSEKLGLNWQENYDAIISDLHPNGLRLISYWNDVEPVKGSWDFSDLDYQMKEAVEANIPVILAIGQKVPRWPECYYPDWVDKNNDKVRQRELLSYLEVVVNRYKNYPNLKYWQVENEPFIDFGVCPNMKSRAADLKEEIKLVKKSDSKHQILITDGGEWGWWYKAATLGDILGNTLYHQVYNKWIGVEHPPLSPEYYNLKRDIVKRIIRNPNKKFIVVELGTEPWGDKQIYDMTLNEQRQNFSTEDFTATIKYAKEARYNDYYLWGAEWWYLQKINRDSNYWEMAKKVIGTGKRK